MSMLVPPQMMNTMAPPRGARRRRLADRGVLRGPGPPLHDPGLLRPAGRLVLAPPGHPRLPARARHVGRRGPHPPLPHQGPRRAAADLPPVLRALHPDGPRRQLDPGDRQTEVRRQARRPARRHARLPAPYAAGARRGGLRRRRGQHAVAAARGVPRRPPGDRQHPRHPAGHEGADGPPAALAAARGRRRAWAAWPARRAPVASRSRSTPTSTTPTR